MKLYISFLASLLILLSACKQEPDFDAVKIGENSWMIKNLDVVTFKNGDTIPESKMTLGKVRNLESYITGMP
jgi:hypothetical protein